MTDTAPTPEQLRSAFDLTDIADDSLTRFAVVHRARTATGLPVVVKRTAGDPDRAASMARWVEALSAAGVGVVTPTALEVPNPQAVDADHWAVYPWVDGEAYAGTSEQIRQAGDLLGRMHAAEVPTDGLRSYAWPDTDWSDVASDLETLEPILSDHGGRSAVATINELGRRWWEQSLPRLRAADDALVRRAVSSDYKANNLVYTEAGPVLVDPDNGGIEPRIFDLALALVLFHNECDGAPGRLFTGPEWQTFATAYLAHVTLTAAERELWPAAVDHMLWEEGSWALEDNDEQAWQDPRQRSFLLDLAHAGPADYPLPSVGD